MSAKSYTWDELLQMIEVKHKTSTDQEWDEAKINAIDCTLRVLLYKLQDMLPDRGSPPCGRKDQLWV